MRAHTLPVSSCSPHLSKGEVALVGQWRVHKLGGIALVLPGVLHVASKQCRSKSIHDDVVGKQSQTYRILTRLGSCGS
eukprot:1157722-Pelagomonas_calceolata.AAC.9